MGPAVVQKELLASAAASGLAWWFAALKSVTLELLGVPLPVVLAAATGAFFAGSFLPPTTYGRAIFTGLAWTLTGVFLSTLTLAVLVKYMGIDLADVALAGVALLISGGGQLMCPLLWPVIKEKVPASLGRRIDQLGGPKQ